MKAAKIIAPIAEAICELGQVPSEHLYTHVMGKMSLESYNKILEILIEIELIKVENHLITWIGPTAQ